MSSTTLPVAGPAAVAASVRALARAYRGRLAVVVCLYLAATAVGLVPPLLLGRLVDHIASGGRGAWSGTDILTVLVAAAVVAQSALRLLAVRVSFALGESVFAALREQFLTRVLALPFHTVERVHRGEILSRSTSDMEAVQESVRVGVPDTVSALVTFLLTVVASCAVNPLLGLTVMAGVPVIVLTTRHYSPRYRSTFTADLAAQSAATSAVVETALAAPTVDALDLGRQRGELIAEALERARSAAMAPVRVAARWFPRAQVGYFLPLLLSVGVGVLLVRAGDVRVGAVAAVALYTLALVDPVDELANWYDEFQGSAVAFARIFGVPEQEPRTAGKARPADSGLRIRDLSFGYRTGRPVLHGVDLEVAAGSTVAVVGASGAGKSTLAMIIAGILRPTAGRVEIGGVPLPEISEDDLRVHIALISQEDHVFRGSIADNVRLGAPEATDADIEAALAALGAEDLPARAGGIDAPLGDDGYEPTPAQAQQLALARILLKAPAVLLLDEATSMLSQTMLDALERAVADRLPGHTLIQVVHRLDVAAGADLVVVLADGRITEVGHHDQLRERGGDYARMWAAWQGGSAAPGRVPEASSGR